MVDSMASIRILLADDNVTNQKLVQLLLKQAGIMVDTADNGKEAVQMVDQYPYDLILMDLEMPEMTGYEAACHIRNNPCYAELPIIAMTAHPITDIHQRCQEMGMNDHLAKPIHRARLFHILSHYIESIKPPELVEKQEHYGVEIPEIPGLDLAEGLQRTGGDRQLFSELLVQFRLELLPAMEALKEAVRDANTKRAAQVVHTIKGSAGNLGMKPVQQAALRLEHELKRGVEQIEDAVLMRFYTVIEAMLTALENILPSEESVQKELSQKELSQKEWSQKKWPQKKWPQKKWPQKEWPQKKSADNVALPEGEGVVNSAEIAPLLMVLANLLKQSDSRSELAFDALQGRMRVYQDRTGLQELGRQIAEFDFKNALNGVAHIAKKLEITL